MRPAVIYTRISRDRAGAGLGVERQLEDCEALAAKLGLGVVAAFSDNDLSAYSGRKPRPGFDAMLALVNTGQVGTILAWHVDRVTRRTRELEDVADICERHDVAVRTVTAGDIDMSTASGRMVARIVGAIAHGEVDHARERMVRAKAQVRAQGRWQGGRRPFGYEPDGVTVRPGEAAVIRDATRRVLAGQSVRSLTAHLNTTGTTTTTGREWYGQSLRAVLIRARNAGLIEHNGDVVGPAAWPAVVSEDEWRAVKTILTDPARVTTIARGRRFLGSGLFLCGVCESVVLVTSATKRGREFTPYVYRCRATKGHVTVAAEHTDTHVNQVMAQVFLTTGTRFVPASEGQEVADLRTELATIKTRLDQLADAYAEGLGFDPGQMLRANTRLSTRRGELEDRLAAVARRSALHHLLAGDDLAHTWSGMTIDDKRAVIRHLAVVRLLPAERRGRLPGGHYFDVNRVQVTPRVDGDAPT